MSLFNDPEFLNSLTSVEEPQKEKDSSVLFNNSEYLNSIKSDNNLSYYQPSQVDKQSTANSLFNDPDFLNSLYGEALQPVQKDIVKKGKYTVADLRGDKEFMNRANNFMLGLGRNEDIFEYLRDSEYSLSSAIQRSFEVGNWTTEQKQDYNYLRDVFRNAELKTVQERLTAAKDIGIDIIADPLNLVSVLFAIPSFGSSVAIKETATQLAKQGINKYTTSQLTRAAMEGAKRPAIYGAAEGVAWAGPYEYFSQSMDVDLGLRDDVDWNTVAGMSAVGGIAGGLVTGTIGGISGARYFDKTFRYANEQEILDHAKRFVGPLDEENHAKFRKAVENYENIDQKILQSLEKEKDLKASKFERFLSVTLGKASTRYLKIAEESEPMMEFLKTLRYDLRRIGGERMPGVKEETYGETVGRLFGFFHMNLDYSLNNIDRVFNRSRFKTTISKEQNDQLLALISTNGRATEIGGKPIDDFVKEAYFGDGKKRIGIKQLLDRAFAVGNEYGLFAFNQKVQNYFPHKFNYSKLSDPVNREKFEDLLIQYNHANPLGIEDVKLQKFYDVYGREIEGLPENTLGTDMQVFGRDFLVDANGNEELAKRLKAKTIVDNMLEKRWTPFEYQGAGNVGNGYGFMKHRVFDIPDSELIPFIETDVRLVLQDYFTNLSQGVARAKHFGKTKQDFENKFINPIREDLLNKGMAREDAEKIVTGVRTIYGKVTGVDQDRIANKFLRSASDWGRLSQQMAHLPLATLSSITEPLILLSRVGLRDTPSAVYEIGHALKKETGKTFDRAVQGIKRLSGKKTKGFKDLEDEEWREIYETGLALEQAVMDRIEGLTGEALTGDVAKGLQNAFFKSNLLTQWTSAVQLASFNTGKKLLRRNIERLYKDQQGITKLGATKKKYLQDQLEDLGVDVNDGLSWYGKYMEDGTFNYNKSIGDEFYNDRIVRGANRFVKEIILNPSTAEANRPLWFSSPAGQLLMQFAGYPTVFSNTVLKKFITDMKDYPTVATPKVALTTLLMTSVAMMGNYVRSGGRNWEEQEPGELVYEAIRRWGGAGAWEYLDRIQTNVDLGGGQVASLAKAFTGPLGQDVIDSLIYRKGIGETALTNIPAYSALPKETRDKLKKFGRDLDKELLEFLKNEEQNKRTFKAKGGIVDVPQAIDEPDERINPYTGEPYNATAEFIQDEEDRELKGQMSRLGFKDGGINPKFEDRINNPQKYPYLINERGDFVTHRMADAGTMVYPLVQLQKDGTLKDYGKDFEGARKAAEQTGNFKIFNTEDEAKKYAEGGYKTDKFNKYYKELRKK